MRERQVGGRLLGLVLGLLLGTSGARAAGLVGRWEPVGHAAALELRADGTGTFQGEPLRYQVQGATLGVQTAEGVGYYSFQLEGDSLTVAGADIGRLGFRRGGDPPPPAEGGGSPRGAAAPPPVAPGPAPDPGEPLLTGDEAPPPSGGAPPIRYASFGFHMQPGEGWRGKETEAALILGHASVPGRMLLWPVGDEITEAEIRAAAREGWSEPGVCALEPVRPGEVATVPTGEGLGLFFEVTGTLQGEEVKGHLAGFRGPTGTSVVVAGLTSPDRWADLQPHSRAMLMSVRLFRPSSDAVRRWTSELKGYKVEHLWSYYSGGTGGAYVGGSQNKEWHLCPDGTYWYRGSSNIAADGGGAGGAHASGYGYGKGSEQGRWEIVPRGADGAAIVFRTSGGGSYSYPLTKKRKYASSYMQKYLGGMKVFAAEYADCR